MKTDFELSRLLKKIGYSNTSNIAYNEDSVQFSGGMFNWNANNDTYTCAELLDVLTFLIDKHNIYVKINIGAPDDGDAFWYYELRTTNNSRLTDYKYEYFDSYTDALVTGLKKACEYLIKNIQ